jgi:hypothetical protein
MRTACLILIHLCVVILIIKHFMFLTLERNRLFGWICFLHPQLPRIRQVSSMLEAWIILRPSRWRHVCWLSPDHMALYPKRWNSSWPPLWEPEVLHHNAVSEVFKAVTMKNVVFCDIKDQFVPHRKHITSLLQILASYCYVRFRCSRLRPWGMSSSGI